MDSHNESKKNKGISLLKGLFEIKRPSKSVQSATLPRAKSSSVDEDSVSNDRLFVRHNSYRKSTRRKNKYKKDNVQKNPDEKFLVENESNVKRLCQQFELAELTEENKLVRPNYSKNYGSTTNTINKEEADTVIEKVLKETEATFAALKELNKNVEVKKRIYEKNSKQSREKKIQSFVEAENEEETEEYRKSLINEMDKELAQMKQDGFLDEDEIFMGDSQHTLEPDDEDLFEDDTFLARMQQNRESKDSDSRTVVCQQTGPDNQELNDNEEKEENTALVIGSQQNILDDEDINIFIERFRDEFSESLADDLENGLHIVEAYNDDGRELIEVQVMIDRKTIDLHINENIDEAFKESDMIFYQNDDKSFDLIHAANENTDYDVKNIEFCDKSGELATISNEEPLYEEISEIYDKNDVKTVEELPKTSNEEGLYEYVEIPNESNPQQPFFVFAPASNRSTMYSTTSQESSVIDDDDEGIEIGRNKDGDEIYSNVRRETFCDHQGIIRIERIASSEINPFTTNIPSPLSRSNSTTPSKRLEFIIDEIKSTEKKYVEDLTKVIKIYKPYIESNTTPDLKNYQGYLFGNIEKIHRRQKKFLKAIEKCGDVDEIVQCFLENELLFELYPSYFRNKPKADSLIKDFSSIIKDMQEKFEERLDFSAYLLTPVQRLGKYILFLENIEKQLEKLDLPVENAQAALELVKEEMSKGNDSVAIESIENSPISKMDYGSFKMREKFNIIKPRKVEAAMVFLFTNVVVLTTTDPRTLETFYYYDSIKMNDLRIATFDDFTIHLTDFTKSKKKQNSSRYTYILESKSEKIWKTWKESIEKILWDQLYKAKENSLNMSVQNGKRYKVNRNRIKSAGSSVFYCE